MAVGPRGHGLLKHLHIGITTEWLIGARRPLAPVVVVRSAKATKDVLFCTDGSAHPRSALEALLMLPWLTSCRVTVLGVNDGRNQTDAAVEQAVATLREHGVVQVKHEVVEALASHGGVRRSFGDPQHDRRGVARPRRGGGARHRRHPRPAGRLGDNCGRAPRALLGAGRQGGLSRMDEADSQVRGAHG